MLSLILAVGRQTFQHFFGNLTLEIHKILHSFINSVLRSLKRVLGLLFLRASLIGLKHENLRSELLRHANMT